MPAWLDTPGLHGHLLGGPAKSAADRRRAAAHCARPVASVPDASLWDSALRQQVYLGDERFVERMQALAEPRTSTDRDIPRAQRRISRAPAQWLASCGHREEALYRVHTESALGMCAIAPELGLPVSRVSRLIARAEEAKDKACPPRLIGSWKTRGQGQRTRDEAPDKALY